MTAGSRTAGWARAAVLLGALACMPGVACAAGLLVEEELRIADPQARPNGLEALLVRPRGDGRFPLALINDGSPRSAAERPNMTPWAMLPQAREFARRGWAAVVVMRRGYGGSGGGWAESYGGCAHPNYVAAGAAAAADLKAAAAALAQRPDIDPARTISVGVSAGGFATVALTADPQPGLAAAISFAGGRGSLEADEVCQQDKLVESFRAFGSRSRVPMLWVYAENDHFFGPELAQKTSRGFHSRWRHCRLRPRAGIRERRAPAVLAGRHSDLEPFGRRLPAQAEPGHAGAAFAATAAIARPACRLVGERPQGIRDLSAAAAAQGFRNLA